MTKDGADVDKDGRVSLLEAYQYAVTETKRSYDDNNRLMTEHAQLDDDAEHKGAATPDGRTGEGMLAWTPGARDEVAARLNAHIASQTSKPPR